MSRSLSRRQFGLAACAGMLIAARVQGASTGIPVPGTGRKVAACGDDFEDPAWEYYPNGPKSSYNIDKNIRTPGGIAKNDRWFEAALRGQPDIVKRVPTPEGGIPGSEGSLLLATRYSGVPGRRSNEAQQDDLIANVKSKLGGLVPVWQTPNVTTRVYVPQVDKWERRNGGSFGFRAGLRATHTKEGEREEYWPGFFIQTMFQQDKNGGVHPSAHFAIRSDIYGRDIQGPKITGPGWWTLGMTFTPDGQVHYFGREGIDDLTEEDHLASYFPYKYRAYALEAFFYNVISMDNGNTWSTQWIVDDPAFYLATPADKNRMANPGGNSQR